MMESTRYEVVGTSCYYTSGYCSFRRSIYSMFSDHLKLIELCVKAFFGIIGCFSGGLMVLFAVIYGFECLKRRIRNGHNSRSKNS